MSEEVLERRLAELRDSSHVCNVKAKDPGVFYTKYDVVRAAQPMLYAALKDTSMSDDMEAQRTFTSELCSVCLQGFGEGSWLERGMDRVSKALDAMPERFRTEFTRSFFLVFMDVLWHAQKSVPVDNRHPPILEEALGMCLAVRRMPPDMRKAYLEHLAAYNAEPGILK